MTTEPVIEIPPGYQRAIRFGANWTMATSPFLPLFIVFAVASGGADSISGDIAQTLDTAGRAPTLFGTTVLLDGVSHALAFVMVVTLFAVLRQRWPVRASLILTFGAWQMILGLTKGLTSLFTFTQLGAAYVTGDAALQRLLLPVAAGQFGMRQGLEFMDSSGVAAIFVMISLLPDTRGGVPRVVRWLGWILAVALLIPVGPTFLVVVLLAPVWQFLLGRWLKSLRPASA